MTPEARILIVVVLALVAAVALGACFGAWVAWAAVGPDRRGGLARLSAGFLVGSVLAGAAAFVAASSLYG
jgi:hypothetical protein